MVYLPTFGVFVVNVGKYTITLSIWEWVDSLKARFLTHIWVPNIYNMVPQNNNKLYINTHTHKSHIHLFNPFQAHLSKCERFERNFNSFQFPSPILRLESLHPASVFADELSAKVSSHQIVFGEFFWIVFLIASSSLFLSHLNTIYDIYVTIFNENPARFFDNSQEFTSNNQFGKRISESISKLMRFCKKNTLPWERFLLNKMFLGKSIQSHVFCKKTPFHRNLQSSFLGGRCYIYCNSWVITSIFRPAKNLQLFHNFLAPINESPLKREAIL